MGYTLGIDVGSSYIKTALIDYNENSKIIEITNEKIRKRNPTILINQVVDDLLKRHNLLYEDILYVASTGEGELVERKRGHFYSMTTHAKGAFHFHPDTKTVVDMGALFCRVMSLETGARVKNYAMTGQCASGSGQFLENITRYLGVTIDEVGPLSLQSKEPAKMSGICAVLAETDVINMVSQGINTADIIKGIHQSIARRIISLLSKLKVESPVALTGGMSQDVGLVEVIKEMASDRNLNLEIIASDNCYATGAIGAALLGGFRHYKLLEESVAQ